MTPRQKKLLIAVVWFMTFPAISMVIPAAAIRIPLNGVSGFLLAIFVLDTLSMLPDSVHVLIHGQLMDIDTCEICSKRFTWVDRHIKGRIRWVHRKHLAHRWCLHSLTPDEIEDLIEKL